MKRLRTTGLYSYPARGYGTYGYAPSAYDCSYGYDFGSTLDDTVAEVDGPGQW